MDENGPDMGMSWGVFFDGQDAKTHDFHTEIWAHNSNDPTRTRRLSFGDSQVPNVMTWKFKDDRAQLNVLFSANRLQLCTKALGNVPILHYFANIFCL